MRRLDELLAPKTKEELRELLLRALAGIGLVTREGDSPGTLEVEGSPNSPLDVVVNIVAAGNLGSATYRVSTDGGSTWGATATVPLNGRVTFDTTLTLVFVPGPAGTSVSFEAGENYTFSTSLTPFPVTSWQAGSAALQVVEMDAEVTADVQAMVARVAALGFLDTATGPWLDLLGTYLYGLARELGEVARHVVTLSCAATAGPHNITEGQLYFLSTSGKVFRSTGTATIPSGGSTTITVVAERPGASYNVGAGTITTMTTQLAGVTCTNAVDSQTVVGTDEETDTAYRARCRARWPSLGTGAVADTYDLWARTASSEVTKTLVRASPTVEGEVDVFVAGDGGEVSAGALTDVEDYIVPRVPLCATANVQNATESAQTVTATVYVAAESVAQAEIDCSANLERLFQELAIGGTLYVSNIIEELSTPTGVRNVTVSAPAADVELGETEVATLTANLTFVEV